jgi:hypothetical protein
VDEVVVAPPFAWVDEVVVAPPLANVTVVLVDAAFAAFAGKGVPL